MAILLKKLVKRIIGRSAYAFLLNTELGRIIHDRLHSKSSSSRDFLLQAVPKFSICAEIGVHEGDFSERILEIVRPKKIHLIDPWKFEKEEIYQTSYYGKEKAQNQKIMDSRYNRVVKRFGTEIKKGQVVVNRGYSEEILSVFDNEYLDWVYIDGNHLYDFVKKDLDLCYTKLKKGGFIMGDDYNEGGWWKGGVKKAVDEFVNTGLVKIIQIKNSQYILQK